VRIFSFNSLSRLAVSLLGLVVSNAIMRADTATFTLGSDPGQTYMGINAGPYPGTLTDSVATVFFCLNLNLVSMFGGSYAGITSPPVGQGEDESAFLASYLLSQGPPSTDPNFVKQYEGPISFAIWQLMGSLGGTPPDPAAAYFVDLAQEAYNDGLLTPAFLANFLVFTPNDSSIQSFITVFQDNVVVDEVVPEPRAVLLLASGLLALCGWRYWRRADS